MSSTNNDNIEKEKLKESLKTLSISSTDSLNSSTNDIILVESIKDEKFDYSKTGAIPKTRPSITSTSTSCSSLSSFVSQNSKKSKQNQSNDCQLESVKCPLCFKSIETTLESHFESDHKEYECPFCGLLFDNDLILNQHLQTVHNEEYTFDIPLGKAEENSPKKDVLICPVCQIEIKDELWLEIHVDSHFNPNPTAEADKNLSSIYVNRSNQSEVSSQKLNSVLHDEDGLPTGASTKIRTCSNSSLTANVDENFEIDQIITLSESNDPFERTDGKNMENYKSDYELALMLDQEEKEKFQMVSDETEAIKSQLLERQKNEALKYKLTKENQSFNPDYALDYSLDYQSDSEYAAELEHEWLKQRFGMNNTKASTRALENLERAFKSNKIDIVTYHHEKDQIEARISSVYDDGTTCSKDLIELIKSIPLTKAINKRLTCTKCDHYSSGFIDSGYGCGYRNTQILLSSIREDPLLRDIIFNNNNVRMPSVSKIQQLIEQAWANGFDLMGKNQLGGVLYNTAKWIGASDVAAMFFYLRIRVELVDFKSRPNSQISIGKALFDYVKNYFEQEIQNGRHIHPIYLQHEGHSRTIVGVEYGKNENFLIFDPANRKSQIEKNISNKPKLMGTFRKGLLAFNKKKEYQLLIIRGAIASDEEYQRSKVLASTRIEI